jgi:hypothetical protein
MNLDEIKPGDKVILINSRGTLSLITVDRITPSLVICGSERYQKITGRRIGSGSWDFSDIQPVTPELMETLAEQKQTRKHKNNARFLNDYNFLNLAPEIVERIMAIIEAPANTAQAEVDRLSEELASNHSKLKG